MKLNVARRPASLAYRIVADGPYEAAAIAWEGESDQSAEDLIGRTRDASGQASKTAQLATAIRDLVRLNGGSIRAADAYRALEADGVDTTSKDNVTRAASTARGSGGPTRDLHRPEIGLFGPFGAFGPLGRSPCQESDQESEETDSPERRLWGWT